jgi:hypothetical protein
MKRTGGGPQEKAKPLGASEWEHSEHCAPAPISCRQVRAAADYVRTLQCDHTLNRLIRLVNKPTTEGQKRMCIGLQELRHGTTLSVSPALKKGKEG